MQHLIQTRPLMENLKQWRQALTFGEIQLTTSQKVVLWSLGVVGTSAVVVGVLSRYLARRRAKPILNPRIQRAINKRISRMRSPNGGMGSVASSGGRSSPLGFSERFSLASGSLGSGGGDAAPLSPQQLGVMAIPVMLRKLGFNPKGYEIKELCKLFLEDEFIDTVEYHEWLFMIEAKMKWGDDFEIDVTRAMAALGQDDKETGFANIDVLKEELMTWGEPLSEIEFVDWPKMAVKDKNMVFETGIINYTKFVETMNDKDALLRAVKEPVNFFKMDQKTLAAMAIVKAQEEREEAERKEAEKKAREEAKRQKMIADGLLPPDN